ncbi:MAG: M13 family metallopeptidase [Saprospiraceae bacterium]|nr:M13 family metallopeptidase [Saprospiraceae bacterium]
MKSIIFTLTAILLLAYGCKQPAPQSETPAKDILSANMDTTVNPGDDFFAFANGGWIKNNPIPDEQSSWGIAYLVIEENRNRLRKITEQAAAQKASQGSAEQKIGDFWATAMDSAAIGTNGLKPLQPLLDEIDAIKDAKQLSTMVGKLERLGVGTIIGTYIGQDSKNSEAIALQFWQTGLGLPEREYYFKNDSATQNIRNTYLQHVSKMLQLSGLDQAAADKSAKDMLALETGLAKVHRKLEDLRDPYANYNKMSLQAFYKMCPNCDLPNYLNTMGIPKVDSVIVGQPEYYKALDKALKSTPLLTWKHNLRYHLLESYAETLPDDFGNEAFAFSQLFSGAKTQKPRWKRVIEAEENMMGELLGQLYVKEYFDAKAKKRYEDLVESVRAALKARIEKLTWMSDSTKQKAYVKLATMKKKVGYPDKWKDFSAMKIGRESYAQNMMNAHEWWHQYQVNKLGKPVDRDEWDMTPQTYNAYYNPSNNEIVLPAGIFTVPGFRDEELDDALVYGYAGASTIGHEITHGFDDQGRQFDEKGNLVSWWTKDDEEKFNKRAEVMVNQFNQYEPLPGYKINGKATLGENIADLGGILLGWDAFVQTAQYKENKSINGLNPAQRYFLGYALGWLGHIREEALKTRLLVDVHSPAKWRVNGPYVSVDAFYETFGVKSGQAMYVPDSSRVRIW